MTDFDIEELKKQLPCQFHNKLIQEMHVALCGNGHPETGLLYRHAQNTERLAHIECFVKRVDGMFWKVIGFALIGSLSAVATLIIMVVRMLAQHGML